MTSQNTHIMQYELKHYPFERIKISSYPFSQSSYNVLSTETLPIIHMRGNNGIYPTRTTFSIQVSLFPLEKTMRAFFLNQPK